ncbi:ubiquitin-like protein ISG15 [Scleropages formosus]|uniref:ubiquitin-like protein ISG15 n=1 Tax=Scleropages formosus TaxID=113540 RepID=UPI00087824B6|nr:polyubiquitin-like [Scleropages formosus]
MGMMELIITFMNGNSLALNVDPNITVSQLKGLIETRAGVSHAKQQLCCQNGQKVELSNEHSTLLEYGLRSGSTVSVLIVEPHPFQVFLKNEKGQTHTYEVAPGETVEMFKKKVYNKERVPMDQQRLIYEGKQMEDNRTLEFYGVKREGTIYLTLRLRGG